MRTPEDFLSFTQARKDPEKLMPDWLGAHPEALPAIQATSASGSRRPATPPAEYNSIHSFRWIDADGGSRFVRYRFEPEAGEQSLSPEEAKERGRDYLQEEIARPRRERLPGPGGDRGRVAIRSTTRRSSGPTSASASRSAGW